MIKKLLSRLFSRQSREQIIEDPRFHENEIGTKLVGWREQRSPSHFEEQQAIERGLAEERRQIAMQHERERLRENIEKRKEPSEAEILGPSDSKD